MDNYNTLEAIETLKSIFYRILKVNLTTDDYIVIKDDFRDITTGLYTNLSTWTYKFAYSGQVFDDDIKGYLEFVNINRLREYFKNNKSSTQHLFRRKSLFGWEWAFMELTPCSDYSDDNQTVLLFIRKVKDSYIDELGNELDRRKTSNYNINTKVVSILNNIEGGLLICDDDENLTFQYIGKGIYKIQGYNIEEFNIISGGSLLNNVYSDDKGLVKEAINTRNNFFIKYRIVNKEGNVMWVSCNAFRVKENNDKYYYYCLYRDITVEQEKDIAFKQEVSLKNMILDTIRYGIFAYTLPDHKVLLINDQFRYLIEDYNPNPIPRFVKMITEKVFPEDRIKNNEAIKNLKEIGDEINITYRVKRDDGRILILNSVIRLLELPDGRRYILSSMIDVTDSTNLHKTLIQERRQYRDALTNDSILYYSFCLNDGLIDYNSISNHAFDYFGEFGENHPDHYDDIMIYLKNNSNIRLFDNSNNKYLTCKGLKEAFQNGRTRIDMEFYNTKIDVYLRSTILLSKDEWTGNINAFFILFNISNERKKEIEENRKLQEQYEITKSFSTVYFTSWIYDIEKRRVFKADNLNISYPINQAKTLMFNTMMDHEYIETMKEFLDEDIIQRLKGKQILTQDYYTIDKKWCRASFIPMSYDHLGNLNKVLFSIQDVTESKEKEEKAKQALIEAYENQNRANNAKTDFLANMSHDIRTPMNAIIGMTAIMKNNINNKEKLEDCLSKINTSSRHLLTLINEVLDMSKIESGKMDLHQEEFSLPDLIDDILAICNSNINIKNLTLNVSFKDLIHEKVIGDNKHISQALINIISNAINYTPNDGNINLTLIEKTSNRPMIGCYQFIIEDNGIGMSKEFMEHLFEPFTRSNDVRIKNIQGTGLGMPITYNIIKMMDGDIEVQSELNKGTKFVVTIYLQLQEEEQINHDFKDLPVLIVDDNRTSCISTMILLESLEMKPKWVLTGKEAIKEIDNNNYKIVLVDWKMPEMDGIEITKRLRNKLDNDVPIIILSAYDWKDIENDAFNAGATTFISKPLFKSKLIRLFNKVLYKTNDDQEITDLSYINNSSFEGKKVLVVEDNELNAQIIGEILKMANLEVEYASNGKEALDIMSQISNNYYSLIFMDIQMPIMDGYDATRAIRALPTMYTKKIPIIAMSANAFAQDVQAAKLSGMNEHLAKPIDFKQLLKVLNKWL